MNRVQLRKAQIELGFGNGELADAVGVSEADVVCWRAIGKTHKPIPTTVEKCIALLLKFKRLTALNTSRCSKCNQEKPAHEFLKSQQPGWCKACSNELGRERYRRKSGSKLFLQKHAVRLYYLYGTNYSVKEAAAAEGVNRVTLYAFMNKFDKWLISYRPNA